MGMEDSLTQDGQGQVAQNTPDAQVIQDAQDNQDAQDAQDTQDDQDAQDDQGFQDGQDQSLISVSVNSVDMRKGCLLKYHICSAATLGFLGFMAFFVFIVAYQNYVAGTAGGVYSITNLCLLHLHLSFKNDAFVEKYPPVLIGRLLLAAVFLAILSFLGVLALISIAIVNHVPVLPVHGSFILAAVQTFIVTKSAITQTWFLRKYRKMHLNLPLVDDFNERAAHHVENI